MLIMKIYQESPGDLNESLYIFSDKQYRNAKFQDAKVGQFGKTDDNQTKVHQYKTVVWPRCSVYNGSLRQYNKLLKKIPKISIETNSNEYKQQIEKIKNGGIIDCMLGNTDLQDCTIPGCFHGRNGS